MDVSGEENVFVCGGHGAEEEMLLHDVHRGFVHFFVLVGEAAKEDVHLGTLAWHPLGIVEKDGLHGSGPRRASGASSACDLCFMGASHQTPQPRCARESRRMKDYIVEKTYLWEILVERICHCTNGK